MRGRRAARWTTLHRKLDRYHASAPTHGRHRKNVSSTHVPAWPFNRRAS